MIPLVLQIGLGMFAANHIYSSLCSRGPKGEGGPQGIQGDTGPQGQQLLGETCIRNRNRIEDLSKQITLQRSTVDDNKRNLQGQQLLGETCIRNKNRIEDLSKQVTLQRSTLDDNKKNLQGQQLLGETCIRNKNRIEDLSKQVTIQRDDTTDRNKEVTDLNSRLSTIESTVLESRARIDYNTIAHRTKDDKEVDLVGGILELKRDTSVSKLMAGDTRKRLSILEEAMSRPSPNG